MARRHPETLSLRYLAPPLTVLGVGAGLAGGLLGLALRVRPLALLLAAPLTYAGFVASATAVMKDLSPGARLRLPLVLAIMHMAWGAGFVQGVPDQP